MEKIFEHKKGHVLYYHDELKCIHIHWKDFVKKQDMMDLREEVDKLFSFRKPENWIANMNRMTAMETAGQEWGFQVWVPEVLGKGIKRMVVIQPNSSVGKLTSRKAVVKFQESYTSCEVTSLVDGLDWLETEMGKVAV